MANVAKTDFIFIFEHTEARSTLSRILSPFPAFSVCVVYVHDMQMMIRMAYKPSRS